MQRVAVGEYNLAVQRGPRAAYAYVRLEASEGSSFAVDVDAVEAQWRAAAHFGVQYAHERLGVGARLIPRDSDELSWNRSSRVVITIQCDDDVECARWSR